MSVVRRIPEDRSSNRWGTLLALVGLGIVLGSFVFSYVYLWARGEDWPPIEAPPVGLPAIAGGLLVAATVVVGVVRRRSAPAALHAGLGAGSVLGTAALVVLLTHVGSLGLDPTAHASASMLVVLLASQVTVTAGALVGTALVQLRLAVGAPASWLDAGLTAVWLLWCFAVVAAVLVGATVYAGPLWLP